MLFYKITLLLINLFFIGVFSSDPNLDECKTYTSSSYLYKKQYAIPESSYQEQEISFVFFVKTSSNAHLRLTSRFETWYISYFSGYEIVIGAGDNTYSQIRKNVITPAVESKTTLNFLTLDEPRGFWIKIKNGTISVGKYGESLPFIFWKDPNPVEVRFVGFASWINGIAYWYYDCNLNDTIDSLVEVKQNLTFTEQLRSDLLKDYDPYVIPKSNLNDKLVINTMLECRHIHLNSKDSEITVTGTFFMNWIDEKLKWEPKSYGGIKSIQVEHSEIWKPELVLYNSVNYGTSELMESGLIVNALGEVAWAPMTELNAHCNLDFSSWPWDTHTCELRLGFWSLRDYLKLVVISNATQMWRQRTTSEWIIESIEAESTSIKTPWFYSQHINDDNDDNPNFSNASHDTAAIIKITIKRSSSVYAYVLLLPLIATMILYLVTFFLSPIAIEKLGMQCVCLILATMFMLAVDNSLPINAEHVPYISKAYGELIVMVTVSIIISTLVKNIISQPRLSSPHWLVIKVLNWPTLKMILFFSDKGLNEIQNRVADTDENDMISKNNPSYYWTNLAVVMDRLTFIFSLFCIVHVLMFM